MRKSRAALLAAAAAGGAAVLTHRRQTARWRGAADPDGPDFMVFPAGAERTITTSDGASLAVRMAGEGRQVVLAHGWTNAHAVWAPVARRLVAGGHQVIVYDQRGHGQSTTGHEPFTISRLGADLREVLEALEVDDAVVAGHSMGGMTIMALIADAPEVLKERARSVVLVSTAAAGLGRSAVADAAAAKIVGSGAVARVMSGSLGPLMMRSAIGVNPRYDHLEAMATLWRGTSPQTIGQAFAAIAAMDLRAGLGGCPVPVTVVVGTRDQLTRKGFGKAIADAIPGSRFEVIEGAGHMLPIEQPDRIAELIAKESASAVLR